MTERLTTFDLDAFSRENRTRSEAPNGFNHPMTAWTLSDWMTAVVGEVGEAANVIKKLNRERDGVPGNSKGTDELWDDLADEIADTFIYLDLLAQAAGLRLSDVVRAKFDRTSAKIGYVSARALVGAGARPFEDRARDALDRMITAFAQIPVDLWTDERRAAFEEAADLLGIEAGPEDVE